MAARVSESFERKDSRKAVTFVASSPGTSDGPRPIRKPALDNNASAGFGHPSEVARAALDPGQMKNACYAGMPTGRLFPRRPERIARRANAAKTVPYGRRNPMRKGSVNTPCGICAKGRAIGKRRNQDKTARRPDITNSGAES